MESRTANGLAQNAWENYARLTGGVGLDYDYGKIGALDFRGHGADKGKLPWHPTFSVESDYSTDSYPGGKWSKGTYTPSQEMVRSGATHGLANYMRSREPNVILKAPVPYSMANMN